MKGLWPELPWLNIIYCIYKFQIYDQLFDYNKYFWHLNKIFSKEVVNNRF